MCMLYYYTLTLIIFGASFPRQFTLLLLTTTTCIFNPIVLLQLPTSLWNPLHRVLTYLLPLFLALNTTYLPTIRHTFRLAFKPTFVAIPFTTLQAKSCCIFKTLRLRHSDCRFAKVATMAVQLSLANYTPAANQALVLCKRANLCTHVVVFFGQNFLGAGFGNAESEVSTCTC